MMKRLARTSRTRGTVMTETLLVLPMLMLILSLIFYFGRLAVRVQHASVMARYEAWRDVANAPGPRPTSDLHNHPQLNSAFFGDRAQSIQWTYNGRSFATEALEQTVSLAGELSADAHLLADAILFRPPDATPRLPHGHREGFRVEYHTEVPLWQSLDGPFRRQHIVMNGDWRYTVDWRAGPDEWTGHAAISGLHPHHSRGLRDAFLIDLDGEFDGIDGDHEPEYASYPDGPQHHDGSVLAGFIRSLYLASPGYHGPIVYDERP